MSANDPASARHDSSGYRPRDSSPPRTTPPGGCLPAPEPHDDHDDDWSGIAERLGAERPGAELWVLTTREAAEALPHLAEVHRRAIGEHETGAALRDALVDHLVFFGDGREPTGVVMSTALLGDLLRGLDELTTPRPNSNPGAGPDAGTDARSAAESRDTGGADD